MTYLSVSSITIPDPLSALLITRVWSRESCLRASVCLGVRFGVILRGCKLLISVLILFRYSSISGQAFGGIQVLFFLKGVVQWVACFGRRS